MMQKGDFVVHKSGKVCQIDAAETMDLTGSPKMYFVLIPVRDKTERIYVPAESAEVLLRPAISREEAMELIKSIQSIEPLQIQNERQREQEYRSAFYTQNYVNMVRIAKDLHRRKEHRIAIGKTLPSRDAQMMTMVEKAFEEGISVALGVAPEEVKDIIVKSL